MLGSKNIMPEEKQIAVVLRDGETAELAYGYFTLDSTHEIIELRVSRNIKTRQFLHLPVIAFDARL
jgi:hypothetical protein